MIVLIREGCRETWWSGEDVKKLRGLIARPPSCTTIRVKGREDGGGLDARQALGPGILELLEAQKSEELHWKVEEAPAGMRDLIILRPQPPINQFCCQKHPRVAVDQHAAAAIMRGADLMAVGVIGVEYTPEYDSFTYLSLVCSPAWFKGQQSDE